MVTQRKPDAKMYLLQTPKKKIASIRSTIYACYEVTDIKTKYIT